jgi:hypothetical protein
VSFSSHNIESEYYEHDITVDVDKEPGELVFGDFLHCKVLFFPASTLYFLERSH